MQNCKSKAFIIVTLIGVFLKQQQLVYGGVFLLYLMSKHGYTLF